MNLETTIDMLAAHLRIDPVKLTEYVQEADKLSIGGYHWQAEKQHGINNVIWPSGSVWWVEGAILYALIRYYKFNRVAEIGGWWGCSATHMAAAMVRNWQDANEHGEYVVYSVDAGILDVNTQHGALIPPEFKQFVKLIDAYGQDWLAAQEDDSLGLVFSDADHTTETTRLLAEAIKPKLIDGGLLIEHDAGHDFYVDGTGSRNLDGNEVGKKVRAGLDAAAIPYRVYLTEPSDCGLGIAQINHAKDIKEHAHELGLEMQKILIEEGIIESPELSTLGSQIENSLDEIGKQYKGLSVAPETGKDEPKKRTRRKRNAATGKLE